MGEREAPDEDEAVWTFRVGVDVSVSARDMAEARAVVERTLGAEDSDGRPFLFRTRQRLADERDWGVQAWELVPPQPSQAALVQSQYPGLVGEIAVIEALRALDARRFGVSLASVVPEHTLERIRALLDDADVSLMVEHPDSGDIVFEGPAGQAGTYLTAGAYRAFTSEDREYAVLVAPSELAPNGRVSAAFPKARHDARTLDEISGLLTSYRRTAPLPELVRQISRRVETTRRPGYPSWQPLERDSDAPAASSLHVGVIVWGDTSDEDPSVLAHRNRVSLARDVAATLHDALGSDAFVGAADFLRTHPGPEDWQRPDDVDGWLAALRDATPLPAFSFHRVTLPPPSEPRDAVGPVARVLEDRARHLATPAHPTDPPSPGTTRGL